MSQALSAGIGGIASLYGSISGQVAAHYNQQFLNMAAADALHRGNLAAAQAQAQGTQAMAGARTALATSGVDTQTGSALTAQTTSRMFSELDAATLRNNAAREAWGLQVKGAQLKAEADQGRASAPVVGFGAVTAGGVSDIASTVGIAKMFT